MTPLTWKMAWEREEVALASVGCCVRLWFPLVSISSSCSAEVGYRDDQEGSCGFPHQDFPPVGGLLFRTHVTSSTVGYGASPNCLVREPWRTNGIVHATRARSHTW